ncbi:hypothetical protein RB653_003309 (mitochondrion) [Dictyostelium firmibasis]|uniref:Ribosomal protein L5 n=1 Tax=Dictyostelium firmibasis TaxID=79012 RepID=A0AAN7YT25_9MYCE
MDILQTYKARIISKYLLNTFSSKNGTRYRKVAIDTVQVKMNYRKTKKEVYQIMELVSLFEQLTGEKPLIKINDSTEKNNVVKADDCQLTVRLRRAKANIFINALVYIGLGERNQFTLTETNNIDLKNLMIRYRYKNLKIFRSLLVRKDMNLEAKLLIELRYKPIGLKKGQLTKYKFYLAKRNEFKIK